MPLPVSTPPPAPTDHTNLFMCAACWRRYGEPAPTPSGALCCVCGAEAAPREAGPAAARAKAAWVLRRRNGSLTTLRSASALRKWIIEGAVTPEDDVSREGSDAWRKLGSIEKVAALFRRHREAVVANWRALAEPLVPPPLAQPPAGVLARDRAAPALQPPRPRARPAPAPSPPVAPLRAPAAASTAPAPRSTGTAGATNAPARESAPDVIELEAADFISLAPEPRAPAGQAAVPTAVPAASPGRARVSAAVRRPVAAAPPRPSTPASARRAAPRARCIGIAVVTVAGLAFTTGGWVRAVAAFDPAPSRPAAPAHEPTRGAGESALSALVSPPGSAGFACVSDVAPPGDPAPVALVRPARAQRHEGVVAPAGDQGSHQALDAPARERRHQRRQRAASAASSIATALGRMGGPATGDGTTPAARVETPRVGVDERRRGG